MLASLKKEYIMFSTKEVNAFFQCTAEEMKARLCAVTVSSQKEYLDMIHKYVTSEFMAAKLYASNNPAAAVGVDFLTGLERDFLAFSQTKHMDAEYAAHWNAAVEGWKRETGLDPTVVENPLHVVSPLGPSAEVSASQRASSWRCCFSFLNRHKTDEAVRTSEAGAASEDRAATGAFVVDNPMFSGADRAACNADALDAAPSSPAFSPARGEARTPS
jgi:hypothetical protein